MQVARSPSFLEVTQFFPPGNRMPPGFLSSQPSGARGGSEKSRRAGSCREQLPNRRDALSSPLAVPVVPEAWTEPERERERERELWTQEARAVARQAG
jgi:hypothetical protein